MAEYIYSMVRARKAVGEKLILDDVTMSFLPGAKIGVVGPNGAGKSSLLKIMAGLDHTSNGDAILSPGYTVGMLAQEPGLDETKTVYENVEEGVAPTKAKVDRFNEISALMADPDADFTELDRRMFLAVEGGLRDSIRAANLTSRELSYAIGEARIRGVSVTLVDNRGAVLPEALRRSVIGLMQQIVSEAQAGRIVARVAPEGYDDAVTILRVDENGGSRLVKISEDGRITS